MTDLQKRAKELGLPDTVIYTASQVQLDTDSEDPTEKLSNLLSEDYGYCHFGFDYKIILNEYKEPSEFICSNIQWDVSD